MVRVYQYHGTHFLFLFLEHRDHEDSSVVSAHYQAGVVNGGIDCLLSDDLIAEEKLILVLVVVVPDNQWVEINQTIINFLGEEVQLVEEKRNFEVSQVQILV